MIVNIKTHGISIVALLLALRHIMVMVKLHRDTQTDLHDEIFRDKLGKFLVYIWYIWFLLDVDMLTLSNIFFTAFHKASIGVFLPQSYMREVHVFLDGEYNI